jgi:Dolichyl-phosphate-mannose-protein mannosyltransferase
VIVLGWLFSLLAPVLIGGLLIRQLCRNSPPLTIQLCLVPVLGLGICSIEFFLWVVIFGRASVRAMWLEMATAVALIAWSAGTRYKRKKSNLSTADARIMQHDPWSARVIYASFAVAASIALVAFVVLSARAPEGGFDAWDHFTIKARFLLLGGEQWKRSFLPVLDDKPDYPFLLPATLARFWMYLGRETALVQVLMAMLFTFATAGLLVSSLSLLRDRKQALLAGLVLLGTPFFVTHGATQYPDVPVGFFFLSVLVLLSLARDRHFDLGVIALAGIFASLAAWTKNEGMAFTFEVIVVQGVVVFVSEGRRECRRQVLAFSFGALPVLILVAWFKLHLAPPNELVPNQGGTLDVFHRFLSRWRFMQISGAYFKAIALGPGFGKWIVNPIPFLLLYGVIAGGDTHSKRKISALIGWSVICLMAGTYFTIFVDLPSNFSLEEYFIYVLDRLLLQLWPSAVFVFFLLLRNPTEGKSVGLVTKMEQAL